MTSSGALPETGRSNKSLGKKIFRSLTAAAASLALEQFASAEMIVATPDVNVGFAGGDLSTYKFNIASLKSNVLRLVAFGPSSDNHGLFFAPGPPVSVRATASVAIPTGFGKHFGSSGTHATMLTAVVAGRSVGGGGIVPAFSDEYYAFSFADTSDQTHYGWIEGSLSGGFSNLSFNLILYAYDTTPGEMITTGQPPPPSTPEPSTLLLGAMASLVLGAAGLRKWKKDQQAASATADTA